MPTLDVPTAIHKLLTCIDICMVMMSMYITSTDARAGVLSHRKKLRNGLEENVDDRANMTYTRRDNQEEELEHPHVKQNLDLLAWHVGVLMQDGMSKPDLRAASNNTSSTSTHPIYFRTYCA